MKPLQIVGIVFLALGLLALVYGGFTYTEERHDAQLGPLEFQVSEKERVRLPPWVGVAAMVVGVGLLFFGRERR